MVLSREVSDYPGRTLGQQEIKLEQEQLALPVACESLFLDCEERVYERCRPASAAFQVLPVEEEIILIVSNQYQRARCLMRKKFGLHLIWHIWEDPS